MKRIIYTTQKGTIAIVVPSPRFQGTMEELAMRVVPQGSEYEVVTLAEIPPDRTFRDAWVKGNGRVDTDIPKAKLIAHSKRREARDEEFKPLDIQATIPSMANVAEQARQAIRDADAIKQISIDNASTPEELKTILGL